MGSYRVGGSHRGHVGSYRGHVGSHRGHVGSYRVGGGSGIMWGQWGAMGVMWGQWGFLGRWGSLEVGGGAKVTAVINLHNETPLMSPPFVNYPPFVN